MSWNGSGTFNRQFSWVADRSAGLFITSSRMDQDTNDITSNGFGNCLTRDGQGSATANQPMNGLRHTGVGVAVARSDYARLDQVQDGIGLNWTTAGGSSDAITATYTPALTALVDGQLCFVRATAANVTTAPTFAPNGLTARTITRTGGAALAAGDIAGSAYEAMLRYNLANTRWELLNPNNGVRTGTILPFAGATLPSGYLVVDGSNVSRTGQAALFAVIGTTYGSGDGSTTFGLPDLRGRVPFGLSNMGGSDSGRLTNLTMSPNGTTLGATGGAQSVALVQGNVPSYNLSLASVTVGITDPGHDHAQNASTLYSAAAGVTAGGTGIYGLTNVGNRTVSNTTGITASIGGTLPSGGSGTAVDKMPPALLTNWMIKT